MMTLETAEEIWNRNMDQLYPWLNPIDQLVALFHGLPPYSVYENGELVGFCDRKEAIERGLIEECG